jgi:hypothetical protein
LQGETTGASDGQFTVLVADLLQVRAALSNPVGPGSLYDIDKTGVVLVNDILETRANLARQLSQITVASGGGGGGDVQRLYDQSSDASWLVDFVEESDNLSGRSMAQGVDLVMEQWPEQLLRRRRGLR